MTPPDSFSVYLRHLDKDEIQFEVLDDGRHVLRITTEVTLYIRSSEAAQTVDGLRELSARAQDMAAALEKLAAK